MATVADKPRLDKPDRLAEQMADGCPSLVEAAHRLRLNVTDAERMWKGIVRKLGAQAR